MSDMFKQSEPVPLHQMVNVALQCELYLKDLEIEELKEIVQRQRARIKSQKQYTTSVLYW